MIIVFLSANRSTHNNAERLAMIYYLSKYFKYIEFSFFDEERRQMKVLRKHINIIQQLNLLLIQM